MRLEVSVSTTYDIGKSNQSKCLFSRIVDVPDSLSFPFEKTADVLHLLFENTPHIINFKVQFYEKDYEKKISCGRI